MDGGVGTQLPEQAPQLLEQGMALLTAFGPRLLASGAILLLGWWGARLARRLTGHALARAGADPLILGFVRSLVHITLLLFVFLAALSALGVQTTSFLAVLGAAGLAVGLALKDSLANLASGFLMVVLRPFQVGDLVEVDGVTGKVEEIRIFNTLLRTGDNRLVILPNARVTERRIVNHSNCERRRLEIDLRVDYSADLRQVRQVLEEVLAGEARLLNEPPPQVMVAELAEQGVVMRLRAWTAPGDLGAARAALNEALKNALDDAGIPMPPALSVRLDQAAGAPPA